MLQFKSETSGGTFSFVEKVIDGNCVSSLNES